MFSHDDFFSDGEHVKIMNLYFNYMFPVPEFCSYFHLFAALTFSSHAIFNLHLHIKWQHHFSEFISSFSSHLQH